MSSVGSATSSQPAHASHVKHPRLAEAVRDKVAQKVETPATGSQPLAKSGSVGTRLHKTA